LSSPAYPFGFLVWLSGNETSWHGRASPGSPPFLSPPQRAFAPSFCSLPGWSHLGWEAWHPTQVMDSRDFAQWCLQSGAAIRGGWLVG